MGVKEEIQDPRFTAMVTLLRHAGMVKFWIRYDDPSEHPEDYGSEADAVDAGPVIWNAIMVTPTGGRQAAAGFDPVSALVVLCERVFDGGQCAKCGRPTAFDPSIDRTQVFGPEKICWRAWNSETKQFERGCA